MLILSLSRVCLVDKTMSLCQNFIVSRQNFNFRYENDFITGTLLLGNLPPTKEEEYVFARVRLSVCPFVCL